MVHTFALWPGDNQRCSISITAFPLKTAKVCDLFAGAVNRVGRTVTSGSR